MRIDDLILLEKAVAWYTAGQRVFWVTVVETWGSAPRPAGATLIMRDDGGMAGSVSGGCIEGDLAEWVRTLSAPLDVPLWRDYGISDTQAQRTGLACGGKLKVLVEEILDLTWVRRWQALLRDGMACQRRVALHDGRVEMASSPTFATAPHVHVQAGWLVCHSAPPWCLLLIGAGQLARHVAHFALALDYRVIVSEPRVEYAQMWDVPDTELTPMMPDDAVRAYVRDARGALLALTHDPRLDDLGLWEALAGPAFYIGALGSRVSAARRRERLLALGSRAEDVARIHGPAGLPLGGRASAEIALAMVAELTAQRYGRANAAAVHIANVELAST